MTIIEKIANTNDPLKAVDILNKSLEKKRIRKTKKEMLDACVSNSERRRIDMQVPDDDSTKQETI